MTAFSLASLGEMCLEKMLQSSHVTGVWIFIRWHSPESGNVGLRMLKKNPTKNPTYQKTLKLTKRKVGLKRHELLQEYGVGLGKGRYE